MLIVKSRRGYKSYTEYDVTDRKKRSALVNRITALSREWSGAEGPNKRYKEACLKFIAINILQAFLRPGVVDDSDLTYVWDHITSKGVVLTEAEEDIDPETLFAPPQSANDRHPVPYKANITASIAAEHLEAKPTEANFSDVDYMRRRIRLRARDIQEHAHRRMGLFFLLCISLHQSKRIISLSSTIEQYGEGAPGHRHAAAHSSLFTAIDDALPERQSRGATPDSIIKGTHFEKTLNATVDLPDEVNKFDSLCEGNNTENSRGMRNKVLPVLNQVSQGDIGPIDAVTQFYMLMKNFFDGKASDNMQQATKRIPATIKREIKDFEEIGTFRGTKMNEHNQLTPTLDTLSIWLRAPQSKLSSSNDIANRLVELQTELRTKVPTL
ncbi:MAG: hypothetical protein COB66_01075 [Coxiella sp. (in: Bacteria)]|nr:MAG: hypothetical protein COB66_01075 [Coxiella sp. (in: g-proteobacteria)]